MSVEVAKVGDTWETLSTRAYGGPDWADVVRLSNPHIFDPSVGNIFVTIPEIDEAFTLNRPLEEASNGPVRFNSVKASSKDEVAIVIGGLQFNEWTSVELSSFISSFSIVSFTVPFDPNNSEFRRVVKPLSFALAQVFIGGKPWFFGRVLPVSVNLSEDSKTARVTCYSLPAVLNDCTVSPEQNTQFKDLNLVSITKSLLKPFALNVVGGRTDQSLFNEPSIKKTETILKFLASLAIQKNHVITDNANGDLVYLQVKGDSEPVAHLIEDSEPLVTVTPEFNSQNWFSHITGLEKASMTADEFTKHPIVNPFAQGVFRPFNFTVKEQTDGKTFTESKYARMLAEVVNFTVTLCTWRDKNGNLWEKNTLIDVTAPGAMIYKRYTFLVSEVKFVLNEDKQTATLKLILPGSYTGKGPTTLPWL